MIRNQHDKINVDSTYLHFLIGKIEVIDLVLVERLTKFLTREGNPSKTCYWQLLYNDLLKQDKLIKTPKYIDAMQIFCADINNRYRHNK